MASDDRMTAINVTPLIDVLIVLLTIFMLVASKPDRSLDVSVPHRSSGGGISATTLYLTITEDGFLLNGSPVSTLEDLRSRLREKLTGEATLLVRGSPAVAYSRVVAAMDVASGLGVSRIGVLGD